MEWQLFDLFCISLSTNQMAMAHFLNNHSETGKSNSIGRNVKNRAANRTLFPGI